MQKTFKTIVYVCFATNDNLHQQGSFLHFQICGTKKQSTTKLHTILILNTYKA